MTLGYKVYAHIENLLTDVQSIREVGGGATYEDAWNQAQIIFAQGRNGWYEHNNRLRILRIEIVKVLNVASFKKMEWKLKGSGETVNDTRQQDEV
jgi:hypothetical protein